MLSRTTFDFYCLESIYGGHRYVIVIERKILSNLSCFHVLYISSFGASSKYEKYG